MKSTEHNTKAPRSTVSSRRSVPFRTGGVCASKTSLRLVLSAFAATLGVLAFASAPALAAAPTVISESVSGLKATEAHLEATVNPENEPTECHFQYGKASVAENEVQCEQPLIEGEEQGVGVTVLGLTQHAVYHYRVILKNLTAQEAKGNTEAFETALTPEKPVTGAPEKVTGNTATLLGELNPGSTATNGYHFAYNTNGECTGGPTSEPGEEEKATKRKVKTPVTNLEPLREYTVCVVSTNEAGEETLGNAVKFKTPAAPPIVETGSASPVSPTPGNPHPRAAVEVHLAGVVNPNNQLTECHFQYGTTSVSENTVPCEPAALPDTFGGQSVGVNMGGLSSGTTYRYRIVAKNGSGEEEQGTPEEFTTAIEPETPEVSTPEPITGTEEVLKGVVNPNAAGNPGTYQFVYEQSATECEHYNENTEEYDEIVHETEATPSLGKAAEAASFTLAHLLPHTTYTFCLLAHNEAGEESHVSLPETFTTRTEPPAIAGESVTEVQYTAATLNAQVDPGGAQTHYYFQYGPTETYGTSTKEAVLGGSLTAPDLATATITGLTPGTTYHYHVVATNSLSPAGGTPGLDKTFTTPAEPSTTAETCPNAQARAEQPFGLTLPDCRAYELVSPEETGGQDATDSYIDANARAAESSAKPAITYASKGSFGEPTGAAATDQFVSRRNAENERWETQAVTPLWNPKNTTTFSSFEATVFTPELKAGIAATDASLPSSGAPTSLGEVLGGLYVSDFATGSYRYVGPGLKPEGASTDLSHVVFGVGRNTEGTDGTVSEWVDGQVVPVSVTNEGAAIEATVGSQVTSTSHEVWHAVSSSGSRVYFSSPPASFETIPVLYLRENAEQKPNEKFGPKGECLEPAQACTIEVDAAEEGAPGPSGGGRYWGASAGGERVFFTDENRLTKDSTAESGDPDLYEYQIEPGHLYGHLTDLTSEATVVNAGEHAAVQGVVQISEDGSNVYFVANGVLTKEPNAQGETATAGTCVPIEDGVEGRACNMYVWHDGITRFIDSLPEGHEAGFNNFVGGDRSDWDNGEPGKADNTEGGPEVNTAVVNPGGTQLAFVSERSLPTMNFPAGYDSEQAATGECERNLRFKSEHESGECREVYLYDTETGRLLCASCDPTGARPVGPSSFASGQTEASAQYGPRNLLADGTLFFDSSDALVPHSSDGRQNVYEYEEGQVHAISNVAGGDESFFLDASPSGEDVFFGSANKLLPQDTGDNVVVWDARHDGGFPFPTAAPPCTTAEACRAASPPTPSVFGTPPSATFSGPGNVAPPPPAVVKKVTKKAAKCKKGDTKNKKGKCVPKKKKKAKKAKKSAHTSGRLSR